MNHPQIATIHGLHEARIGDHSIRLLVMELVEGEDLTLLVERRVSFERAIEIAPDGDAILIPSPLQEEARLDRITVLVNWLDEVERVVPADR